MRLKAAAGGTAACIAASTATSTATPAIIAAAEAATATPSPFAMTATASATESEFGKIRRNTVEINHVKILITKTIRNEPTCVK